MVCGLVPRTVVVGAGAVVVGAGTVVVVDVVVVVGTVAVVVGTVAVVVEVLGADVVVVVPSPVLVRADWATVVLVVPLGRLTGTVRTPLRVVVVCKCRLAPVVVGPAGRTGPTGPVGVRSGGCRRLVWSPPSASTDGEVAPLAVPVGAVPTGGTAGVEIVVVVLGCPGPDGPKTIARIVDCSLVPLEVVLRAVPGAAA